MTIDKALYLAPFRVKRDLAPHHTKKPYKTRGAGKAGERPKIVELVPQPYQKGDKGSPSLECIRHGPLLFGVNLRVAVRKSCSFCAVTMRQENSPELVPGTEIMTDLSGTHFVHAHASHESVVLIPQPTNDPHDPLVCYHHIPLYMVAPNMHTKTLR